MRRCWGLTKDLKRCGRLGDWRLFCADHKKQPIVWIVFLVFTIGGASASLYQCFNPTAATKEDIESLRADFKTGLSQLSEQIQVSQLSEPTQEQVENELDKEFKTQFDKRKKIAQELYNKGLGAYRTANYKLAIHHFEQAIISFPIPSFHMIRGICYSRKNKPDQAFADFNKAIELKPDYVVAYINRQGNRM